MRALIGVAAGIVAGIVAPGEFDQYTSISTAILVGIVFYFASFVIGRRIAKNVPKDKRKKSGNRGDYAFHLSTADIHDNSLYCAPPVIHCKLNITSVYQLQQNC